MGDEREVKIKKGGLLDGYFPVEIQNGRKPGSEDQRQWIAGQVLPGKQDFPGDEREVERDLNIRAAR